MDVPEKLAGFTIAYTGENEDQQESQAFLMRAFVAGLLLIAVILVSQFTIEDWTCFGLRELAPALTGTHDLKKSTVDAPQSKAA